MGQVRDWFPLKIPKEICKLLLFSFCNIIAALKEEMLRPLPLIEGSSCGSKDDLKRKVEIKCWKSCLVV